MGYWDGEEGEKRVEAVIKLWNEGLSASQIANRLGHTTRNAVIAKVHRLRLDGVAMARREPTGGREKAARRMKPAASAGSFRMAEQRTAPRPPRLPATSPYREAAAAYVPPAEQMVSLLDLEDHHCKFPVGDPRSPTFKFCGGQRVDGTPYCNPHCIVAYRPPDVRPENGMIPARATSDGVVSTRVKEKQDA